VARFLRIHEIQAGFASGTGDVMMILQASTGTGSMNKPGISTAIPKRRYRLGEFTLVVLGEVDSSDGVDYVFIMAVVRGQDPEPGLYVTAERPAGSTGRQLDMRIIMRDGSEVIGQSEAWSQLDAFVEVATSMVSRVLNLSDETPWQLL
jgi:hypothetical protein